MLLKLLLFGLFIAVCFGCILLLGDDESDKPRSKRLLGPKRASQNDSIRAEILRLQRRIEVLESIVRPGSHSTSP